MRHLLTIDDLHKQDIDEIFSLANQYLVKDSPCLSGKTVINIFFEHSTRTLTSFEIAAKKLGAHVINFSSSNSSIKKGESILDTFATIEQNSPDYMVIRAPKSGLVHQMTNKIENCAVINAGDGGNEHPTQALIDAFTILQLKKKIAGLKIAICGDILHSRVAHSNIKLLSYLGANVRVISPPNFIIPNLSNGAIVFHNISQCFEDVDVIMVLRLQHERMKGDYIHSASEYFKHYGLTRERLSAAQNDVIVMHPGPINRGVEINSEVADSSYSAILEQVKFNVPIRQAVFRFLT